ncbi:hypothetical protein QP400_10350 [Winkia sp. UMB3158]|uniref:ABC transporter permease n=1 Tax=unclassified Winkia TaxID=2692119 RepID=UPI002555F9CA|nr:MULTISPECIES: ABC transporter permease [unclassified Winkia]MDK7150515.1 hypothetical protein [Winkia sp. UMB3158]MDK7906650.1 hypothetical protein [Winkia sp. UMB0889B]MDK8342157.1 hypothetical protein [Winkia sp. UMB3164B]MDK8566091.1 hypothetical protein [Winkia sp. UMB3164A]
MRMKVAIGFLRQHFRLVLIISIGLLLFSTCASLSGMCRTNFINAIKTDCQATYGGKQYRVGTTNSASRNRLLQDTDAKELVPVTRQSEVLEKKNRSTKVTVIQAGGNFEYGKLIKGRRQGNERQVVLSSAAAKTLGTKIGDQVSIRNSRYDVVGIVLLPAHISEEFAVRQMSKAEQQDAATWLTDIDLEQKENLVSDTRLGLIRINSMQGAINYALEGEQSALLNSWQALSLVLSLATIALLIAGITTANRTATKTIQALRALGIGSRPSWLLTAGIISLSLICAIILGGLFAHLGMWLSYDYIGKKFDQLWVSYAPGSIFTCYFRAFATILISLALVFIHYKWRNRNQLLAPVRIEKSPVKTITVCGVILLVVSAILIWFAIPLTLAVFFPSIIAAVIGFSLFAYALSWVSIGKPLREAGIATTASALTLAPLVAVVIALTTLVAISLQGHANALNYGKPDGDDYIAIEHVSPAHVTYLEKQFPKVMQSAVVFALPDESHKLIRIASKKYAECNDKGNSLTDCRDFVGMLSFLATKRTNLVKVGDSSPELRESQGDSAFYILGFDNFSNKANNLGRVDISNKINYRLGQANLPDWIANPADPQLKNAGIVPGADRWIYIPDFVHNPLSMQTAFRRAASAVSPSIAITEATSVNTSSLHKLSLVVLALGFILSAVLIGTGLTLARKRGTALQFVVNNYGGGDSLLRNLRFREACPYISSIIVATVIGWLMSTPGVAGRGPTPQEVSAGYTWLIPPVLLTVIFLTEAFHLPKNRRKLSTPQE